MVWTREPYLAHMNFAFTGREMLTELFGLMVGLDQEWAAQGAAPDEIGLARFGHDRILQTVLPVQTGAVTGGGHQIVEDTPEYRISIDPLGRRMKLIKRTATLPLPMDYPVKTFDDWLKIKHCYEFSESRIDREGLREAKRLQGEGHLLIGTIPGGFDEPRQLLGEEALCAAYYEEPELIRDILNTISDTVMQVYERVFDCVQPDCLYVHEDMAGKSGPLAGPRQIGEFIKPYYRRIWDAVSQNGCSLFTQDSDGDMNPVIDSFLECGVTHMLPCEPAANMNIAAIREKYGKRLALSGGIDKYVLRGSKEGIRRELETKLTGVTRGGGTVFALDHRIPNGTPIENYRYYVNTAREILEIS